MQSSTPLGVYGFRFLDTPGDAFYQLFALGHEVRSGPSYSWDGLQRSDGPLLLLQYTVSGHGFLENGGRVHRIGPGQAFLVDIPSRHRYYASPEGEAWEFYFILLRPYGLETHWKHITERTGPAADIPPDSPVAHLLLDAFHAAARGRITDGYLASSLVYRLVMELLRFSSARRRDKEHWPPAIRTAALRLEADYARLPGMEEIAKEAGMSASHFTRSFHRATGYTPRRIPHEDPDRGVLRSAPPLLPADRGGSQGGRLLRRKLLLPRLPGMGRLLPRRFSFGPGSDGAAACDVRLK
ncbi:transcriptional regulator [Paenibacillus mucilaginosus 3016]|uniref:Transcriptional regulator n=1 Tax=Paenibacillus mucilaginosus 3016 TaxID=1116391 RepID=H6NLZ2_9BACL|nr:transcriptional regulator [Paenibacillus mucilaginosus 3016]